MSVVPVRDFRSFVLDVQVTSLPFVSNNHPPPFTRPPFVVRSGIIIYHYKEPTFAYAFDREICVEFALIFPCAALSSYASFKVRMIIKYGRSRGPALSDGHIDGRTYENDLSRTSSRLAARTPSVVVWAKNIERKPYGGKKNRHSNRRVGIGRALPGGVRYYSNIIPRVWCMQILLRQQSGTGSRIIITIIVIYYTSHSYNPRTVTVGYPFRGGGGVGEDRTSKFNSPPRAKVARGVGEKPAKPRNSTRYPKTLYAKMRANKTVHVIVMPGLCHAKNAFRGTRIRVRIRTINRRGSAGHTRFHW